MLKWTTILVCLLSWLAGNALAADLTAPDIERFMTTYTQLTPYLDDLEEDEDDESDVADNEDDFLDLASLQEEILKSLAGETEALSIIEQNGYASPDVFAEQAAYITRAYIAHTALINLDEFEASLQNMTPEERENLAAMPFAQSLQETRQQLSNVPDAHIESIRPYLDRLHEVFDPSAQSDQ